MPGPTPLGHLSITHSAPICATFLNGERIMSNDCARPARARRRHRENGLAKAAFAQAGDNPAPPRAVWERLPPLPGLVRKISQPGLWEIHWQTGKIVKTSLSRQDIDTSWFFIAKEGRLC